MGKSFVELMKEDELTVGAGTCEEGVTIGANYWGCPYSCD